jgi:seryl-tRNA synthetase
MSYHRASQSQKEPSWRRRYRLGGTFDLSRAAGVGTARSTSASTFTDFQARRLDLRYRPGPGAKPELVHTLNASGLAFPRTIATLLEHYQEAEGSVRIPPALAAYLGADRLVPR